VYDLYDDESNTQNDRMKKSIEKPQPVIIWI
jgi:hypothetical protein